MLECVAAPAFHATSGAAQRSVTFDRHFVGSPPCMPARRDLLTGRLTSTARGADGAVRQRPPALLRKANVYSHLITDHYHYFEDGGAGYHTPHSSNM